MSSINKREVLAVIPARGGSKSILKKSIAPCAGNPLMYYTIQAAQRVKSITRLIVSTDSIEMASYAKSQGVEVPFMEPKELACDTCPDQPVFEHVLRKLKNSENYCPDLVVHLRPTTPLKKATDIEKAIELLDTRTDAESVRSVCEPTHTPFKMYMPLEEEEAFLKPLLPKVFPEVFEKYVEPYNMPRQLLPTIWRHSGYVDVFRPEVVTELKSMSGTRILPMKFEKWRDVDIDSGAELKQAEQIIEKLRESGKEVWE